MKLLSTCVILMSCYTLQYETASVKPEISMTADDSIQYPGPTKEKKPTYGEDVPAACRGKTYCTVQPPNYDVDKFNKLFEGYKPPVLSMNIQPEMIISPSLVNRQGDPDEQDDCMSSVTYEPLYRVQTKRDGWLDVVQAPKAGYVQKVRLEVCSNPNGKCFTSFNSPDGFTTFCKQKYNSWEVLVQAKNGSLVPQVTELPICCSCHYKSVDLASRFGKPKEMTPVKKLK